MSVKGSVKFSENGKDWILAETFEFGNLKNDPLAVITTSRSRQKRVTYA